MIYCKKCGNPLPDESKFCNECGASVNENSENPNTNGQNDPNGRHQQQNRDNANGQNGYDPHNTQGSPYGQSGYPPYGQNGYSPYGQNGYPPYGQNPYDPYNPYHQPKQRSLNVGMLVFSIINFVVAGIAAIWPLLLTLNARKASSDYEEQALLKRAKIVNIVVLIVGIIYNIFYMIYYYPTIMEMMESLSSFIIF